MTDFTTNWTDYHVTTWRRWLAHLIGQDGLQILEVGSYEGRTACWFAEHVATGKGARIDCVDPWANPETERRWQENTKPWTVIHAHKGPSVNVLPLLRVQGRRYHLIYVDGDHSAAVCLYDLVMGWTMLLPGGLLVADDFTWPGRTQPTRPIPPGPAIGAFLGCYADRFGAPPEFDATALVRFRRGETQ